MSQGTGIQKKKVVLMLLTATECSLGRDSVNMHEIKTWKAHRLTEIRSRVQK